MRVDRETKQTGKSNLVETLFTIVSGLIILATLAYLIAGIFQAEAPPSFHLTHAEPERRGSSWHVEVMAHNNGDEAVRDVHIEGLLSPESDTSAEAILDWLPGQSIRTAVLVFDEQPTASLVLKVKGYQVP